MMEGAKTLSTRPEQEEWFDKLGPFTGNNEFAQACGGIRGGTCYRIKGHPGTQHASLNQYEDANHHGRVANVWFEVLS